MTHPESTELVEETAAANLAALQARQPGFAVGEMPGRIRFADGSWRLVDGDRSTAIHGRQPDREADRAVADLLADSNPDLLVVIGLGLGFFLDALERRGWAGKLLAIELEPATVPLLLARRDWRSWVTSDRLRLLVGPDYQGAEDCGRWIGDGAEQPPVFVHPVLGRLAAGEVARARTLLERIRDGARKNAEARRQFGARYLLNTLANVPALAREADVTSLVGAAPGLPAIVVAAGPSLDRNLEALGRVGDRALVIAVDTALRPLLAAGITPHLVVALDPSEANARHLSGLPPCPGTHLVAEASLDPLAIESFRGRTFLFSVSEHQPWPWLREQGVGRGRLRAWGSVLTSAFDLALQMGCDPIVFAGADLAFTGQRPYARGVVYEADWRSLAEWGVPLEQQWLDQIDHWPHSEEPDVTGTPTRTAAHLTTFRNWLIEQFAREPNRRFVNATGGGILHGGRLEQASLAEVVDELEARDSRQGPRGSAPVRDAVLPASLVKSCYKPVNGARLLAAADRLAAPEFHAQRVATEDVFDVWERFADGLTRPRMRETLAHALHGSPTSAECQVDASARASVSLDAFWMERLAANLPLVAMAIPQERMYPRTPNVRLFRFRTTTARMIACLLQLPDGAVAEDGVPLRQSNDINVVAAGEYFIWRDEVYFASTDGTDPRYNHRAYTLLVAGAVAYVEGLPLHEVLTRHV